MRVAELMSVDVDGSGAIVQAVERGNEKCIDLDLLEWANLLEWATYTYWVK
jgi:hypothetical protein